MVANSGDSISSMLGTSDPIAIDPSPYFGRCPFVQVLMGPHMIIPNPKQPPGRCELFPRFGFPLIELPLQGAEEALDAPVHPGAARHRGLMPDIEQPQRDLQQPGAKERFVFHFVRMLLKRLRHIALTHHHLTWNRRLNAAAKDRHPAFGHPGLHANEFPAYPGRLNNSTGMHRKPWPKKLDHYIT